jgi:colanic acid biosynthesis glycosyl transferase WcaI
VRILIVSYLYPPEVQSLGVMARELAEDLTRLGHHVTVITGWPSHPEGRLFDGWVARFRSRFRDSGFDVIRCRHSFWPRRRMIGRLMHHATFAASSFANGVFAGRADVVLSLSAPIFGHWAAWMLAQCSRASFVYMIDDLHPETALNAGVLAEGLPYRVLRRLDTTLCHASDLVLILSETMERGVIERGVGAEKVKIVPFWIDTSKVRPGDRDNPWRRAQGIPPETFVALYAGTMGLISGGEILLDVARLLADRGDISIVCVGAGIIKDRIESEAGRLGLARLRFLPFQPEEVLSDVQATADVGLVTLLPRSGESSIPSKVLGYMAAARPVIASVRRDSDLARLVNEAECGTVVPPQDAAALAAAVREAADSRDEAQAQGKRGRRYVEERFARTACTRVFEGWLREVAET